MTNYDTSFSLKVLNLHNEGKNIYQIAKLLNKDYSNVRKIVRKNAL